MAQGSEVSAFWNVALIDPLIEKANEGFEIPVFGPRTKEALKCVRTIVAQADKLVPKITTFELPPPKKDEAASDVVPPPRTLAVGDLVAMSRNLLHPGYTMFRMYAEGDRFDPVVVNRAFMALASLQVIGTLEALAASWDRRMTPSSQPPAISSDGQNGVAHTNGHANGQNGSAVKPNQHNGNGAGNGHHIDAKERPKTDSRRPARVRRDGATKAAAVVG